MFSMLAHSAERLAIYFKVLSLIHPQPVTVASMSDKHLPVGSVAKQKSLLPTAWLTGHLPPTVWWLQLPAAIHSGSVASWQALTAALHASSAPFCIACLPTEPAELKKMKSDAKCNCCSSLTESSITCMVKYDIPAACNSSTWSL